MSPYTCSNLPESTVGHSSGFLFGLAPNGVYHRHACYQPRGALLPHLFTLTVRPQVAGLGGFLSAALSVGSHLPGVTWRSTLWSPDFPLLPTRGHYSSGPRTDNNDHLANSAKNSLTTFNKRSNRFLKSTKDNKQTPILMPANDRREFFCADRLSLPPAPRLVWEASLRREF